MVRILEFRRPESSDPAQETDDEPRNFPKGHCAEVIIFPGVRIERQQSGDGDGDLPTRPAKRAEGPARRK